MCLYLLFFCNNFKITIFSKKRKKTLVPKNTLPVPSPAQVAAIAMSAGLAVTSTSTPSLNGTYSVGAQAQADITSVMTGVAVGVGLPGGGSSFYWLDSGGTPHNFTQAQFLSLATAIRNYVYLLDMYGYGQGSQPTATATIP